MSARIKVCGRSPVIVVDAADELRAIGIAEFAGRLDGDVSPGRAENRST